MNEDRIPEEIRRVVDEAASRLFLGSDYYGILDEVTHKVRGCTCSEWAEWAERSFKEPDKYRRVGRTNINGFMVSTVFLTINHQFGGDRPQWFETMIFKEDMEHAVEGYQWRYADWEEAAEGHETVVTMIREGILP